MPFLKLISVQHVLAHAKVDLGLALGLGARRDATPYWVLATPIAQPKDLVESTRFYRSIAQQVDDDDKRASLALLLNSLGRAAQQQNYQDVLKGSNIYVKCAHSFRYENTTQKLWELKQNKKDRLYFFSLTYECGPNQCFVIAPLLAHHKKDQNTPKEVSQYCEKTMKQYLERGALIQLCKE